MRSRLELHNKLVDILGSINVYYQPPESLKMNYPCIVYERYDIPNTYADDDIYTQPVLYRVTVLDPDPDSEIVKKVAKDREFKYIRHQVINNLNHDTFNIYY